ncbi:hypothetical protein YC2023_023001 [Brassica napus]
MTIFAIERIDEHKGTNSIFPLLLAVLVTILYWRQDSISYPRWKKLDASYSIILSCRYGPCLPYPYARKNNRSNREGYILNDPTWLANILD